MNDPVKNFKPITPDLYTSAGMLAATAYFDNPAHIYLCPEEATRFKQLEWLLGAILKMHIKKGAESFCYPENGVIQAMGFWTTPNETKINFMTKVKAGLLKVPFKMGWSGYKRVMETSSEIDRHLELSIGLNEKYLFLNNFVMQENRQCKGWGSKILEHQFELISEKSKYSILVLTTHRFWTVKFYERHGFEIIFEEEIGTGPNAFTNWTMKKTL